MYATESRDALAGYRCTACHTTRAWGSTHPDPNPTDYQPLLQCEGCGCRTRHAYVGMREFNWRLVDSPYGLVKQFHPILPDKQSAATAGSV